MNDGCCYNCRQLWINIKRILRHPRNNTLPPDVQLRVDMDNQVNHPRNEKPIAYKVKTGTSNRSLNLLEIPQKTTMHAICTTKVPRRLFRSVNNEVLSLCILNSR